MKHITNKMNRELFLEAIKDSFVKLNPKIQTQNFVMFTVYIGAILITISWIRSLFVEGSSENPYYIFSVAIILWITSLFSNFAESLAEGKSKAQTQYLKNLKKNIKGFKLEKPNFQSEGQWIDSSELKIGDYVLVEAENTIPKDGTVILGVAYVDESALTGESTPIKKESGDENSSVTGGSRVISDKLLIRITEIPGQSFLDKVINMVESSNRKKTPNEIALEIFLITLTIIFIVVTVTLFFFNNFVVKETSRANIITLTTAISLLVCLAPTTIGALLSSIGIAGMTKLNEYNVLALSGRAIEAAGDVDVLLLDKTGTITLGNRQAYDIIPINNKKIEEVAYCALISSLSDETPEGRSIVDFVKNRYGTRANDFSLDKAKFIKFSAATGISGVNIGEREVRKGSEKAIKEYLKLSGKDEASFDYKIVENIAQKGGTPLLLVENFQVIGIIHLKDIIKKGLKEQFYALQLMGIKTIMITGDNPITAAAIAEEVGVNNYYANSTPDFKLKIIREYQSLGHLVAMTGDGTNDAPALSQADVAVVMNTGTAAAKEAGNMIDLDSNPVKLIEIVKIGKQMLMTRGALTTFSIANDISKYFTIVPVLFIGIFPQLEYLNVMKLHSSISAILSALLYNAFIIVFMIPLAIKGVKYKEDTSINILKKNILIYGVGGIIIPFIAIKGIDLLLVFMGVV